MTAENRNGTGPLSHLRVLDITEFLAGPFGTQILGDLGAEVIKIEPPQGDASRHVPPTFVAGSSSYFTGINRNKRSLAVDLKSPEGIDIVRALAQRCDVLVENRRPRVLAKLGLTYDEAARANPRLIWCSISGFGQDGPDRDAAAYDMVVQAMSGGMSLTGEKGGRPVRAGVPIGDLGAGLYGVIGILAALARREQTGIGDYIDIAMLDVQIAFLSYQASQYLNGGKVPGPQGREHDSLPTYRCFEARDGRELAVTANTEKMWQDMCRVLARPDLIDDPRFASVHERNLNRNALIAELEAAFKAKDAAEWVPLMRAAGVPVGPINTIDRALAEPQVRHRGMVVTLAGPNAEERARVVGNPIKLRNAPLNDHCFPPRLGQDSRDVLSGLLGYSAEQIAGLIDRKVVGASQRDESTMTKAAPPSKYTKAEYVPPRLAAFPVVATDPSDGRRKLSGSCCTECRKLTFPPSPVCAHCGCENVAPVPLSEHGTLYSYSVLHVGARGWPAPYVLGYVDLPENVRIFTHIDGAPETLRVDMPVSLEVREPIKNPEGQDVLAFTFRPSNR